MTTNAVGRRGLRLAAILLLVLLGSALANRVGVDDIPTVPDAPSEGDEPPSQAVAVQAKPQNAASGLAGALATVSMLKVGIASAVGATLGKIGVSSAVTGALNHVGFTSSGIAAGSWAAKWMSSSAIANGGGVAAGSWVAKLQSVATLGLGSTASAVVGAAVVGGASIAIAKALSGRQHECVSALEPPKELGKLWVVATSDVLCGVCVTHYKTHDSAREAFDETWCLSIWCSKILFDPYGRELVSFGQDDRCDGIRKVMRDHYFRQIYFWMEIAVSLFIGTILAVRNRCVGVRREIAVTVTIGAILAGRNYYFHTAYK